MKRWVEACKMAVHEEREHDEIVNEIATPRPSTAGLVSSAQLFRLTSPRTVTLRELKV
jgi:hypothetical protein